MLGLGFLRFLLCRVSLFHFDQFEMESSADSEDKVPFSQAPVFASETAAGIANLKSNITAFNDDLSTRLATFEAANSGTTSTIFNTDDSMSTVLDSPTTYGATDATCMNSDGTTCCWYDNYHPGQAIHKVLAQNFVTALTGTFF